MNFSSMKLGELITMKAANHRELRDANRVVAKLKEVEDAIDAAIIVQLDAIGTTKSASDDGSISITETEEPNVDDWDAVYDYIKTTGDFHILQRRPSSTAYRELLKSGIVLPGMSSRLVRRVNFRSK